MNILVILNDQQGAQMSPSYLINGDGDKTSVQIEAPSDSEAPYYGYILYAQSAVVQDNLYIFGGRHDRRRVSLSKNLFLYFKVARLDSCSFVELSVKLIYDRYRSHAALSISDGGEGC